MTEVLTGQVELLEDVAMPAAAAGRGRRAATRADRAMVIVRPRYGHLLTNKSFNLVPCRQLSVHYAHSDLAHRSTVPLRPGPHRKPCCALGTGGPHRSREAIIAARLGVDLESLVDVGNSNRFMFGPTYTPRQLPP